MDQLIIEIQQKFVRDQVEFSKHAVDQSILRKIRVYEIREAIANEQIIEHYPQDKYGPSCLILGLTVTNRPLHVQCSYPNRPLIKVITVYEPDFGKWTNNFTKRRISHNGN
ncbi:DUF4258 domain-containing protein [Synechococcus sp. PCC 6312]|uniref:DUF4258 domain-containing protein n=1 Tax=Synechococcus sp. (strain ATCC 27167 / PCC 6312) TaxID=195253 RepID=UPI00029F1AEE|nr:DUF4258 domain-containing protein [Synechococcus sp. PCC 6312]AFY61195.1 hypothetical protein Syn6312_2067 [Synechococcus sp. PCC 6312]